MTDVNVATTLPGWRHVASGKVRDLFVPDGADTPDDTMLLVASNRVSAFDAVLEPEIPGKGALLTRLALWWFAQFPEVPNHLVADQSPVPDAVADRSMLVRRLQMHPVECVVRGYLTGSGLLEYQSTGSVSGVPLPAGLVDGDRLPQPIFTPAFKAEQGAHDENISFERVVQLVGQATADGLRARSLEVFAGAEAIAATRGVILADTKFEFGDDPATGELTLADEVLTSDSSRYWDGAAYAAGRRGVSFDKDLVRKWLRANWDQRGTAPRLPDDIVQGTAARYAELIALLVD